MALVQNLIGAAAGAQSQDCLFLNVWTPRADGKRRPVLVWLHGGAFVMGSGSTALYAGARLARLGDVVVVTVNYRLGALGYLNLRELGSGPSPPAANLGLRDQIAALEWVRDNIEAFGGDPDNVTLFGESAGGMSVGTLLGTPRARGLFHRAILQSGAAHNVMSQENATQVADQFMRDLGVVDLSAIQTASVSDILAAQRSTTAKLGLALGSMAWQPSVDGDLLPTPPLEAIEKGRARDVPILVGTNRDEWKLFMLGDRKARSMDIPALRRRLERALRGDGTLVERALETYRSARGGNPSELWQNFQSDRIFHYPAHRLAQLQAAHNPNTYAYLFSWAPPIVGQRVGACHGIEIPFVFGTLREPVLRPLFGLTQGARQLSDRMMRAWIAFARTGRPAHADLSDWPAYGEARTTQVLAAHCRLVDSPFEPALSFWADRERARR
jgi:para-nitrobenzyl esterase